MPQLVTETTGKIKFEHTFSGEQIRRRLRSTEILKHVDPIWTSPGGVEYVNCNAETYFHPKGRIFFKDPAITGW